MQSQPQEQAPQAGQSWPQDPNSVPKGVQGLMFNRSVPGQSLTSTPKNAAYEHPPQFTDIEEAMNYVMDQITEPEHLTEMFKLLNMGISVEEFVRVILFTGFASGKWTPTLGISMFKPLMLAVISICARTGHKDVQVVMSKRMQKKDNLNDIKMIAQNNPDNIHVPKEPIMEEPSSMGFMNKGIE